MDIIVERISELIGKKHGAKKEFADAIGVSQNIVTSWLGDRTKSYNDYLPKIAAHYHVSLDWLSGISDEKTIKENPASNADGERDWAIAAIDRMSDEDFAAIVPILERLESQHKDK